MQSALKKYEATVVEVREETQRVNTIKMNFDGIESFSFEPGEYFLLSIPGFVNEKGVVVRKAYSIASSPEERGYVAFTITAKTPVGLSTRTHQLKVGDRVVLEGPAGKFRLNKEKAGKTAFISGGSGISSLRSMFVHLLKSGYKGRVRILQGCREPEDQIYLQELESLQDEFSNFEAVPTMSGSAEGWEGLRGRVTEVLAQAFPDAAEWEYYVCGPAEMVKDTIEKLAELGVQRAKIFREVW